MTVRVRMAPSPTGDYHIGHIRTVLYNWAFARKHGGKFIIRIEDTDRERFVEGATERILSVIESYGLDWDEGPKKGGDYGPYTQSQRLDLYKKYADELVKKGLAYPCFCTKERLDALRAEQREQGLPVTKYDKHCAGLSPEEVAKKIDQGVPYVIRFNVPSDRDITFEDEVYGSITVNSDDIDDQVLIKSDGYPTYHMAVVVDDHLMEITHIMRGMDWIPSTPKHVLLYEAFGWEMPTYAHLPNIKELGAGKKLSKRFGSVFAVEFLREGYLPEALLNFLMFLGWNPGTEKEIYSLDEFVKDFSLKNVHKTDLVAFDRKKLLWMNGQYIRDKSSLGLLESLKEWAGQFDMGLVCEGASEEFIVSVLDQVKNRMKLLTDFNDHASFYFEQPEIPTELLVSYTKDSERTEQILLNFISLYGEVSSWDVEILEKKSHDALEQYGYSPKEAFMTLRVAITGQKATPPLFDILGLLGKDIVLTRLNKAVESLR
jgi:glutamyl-tRNA synthetase